MRVAYVTSRYPDVSHTFIFREVQALRTRGVDVRTFSIRRATRNNVIGSEAQSEAARTRWLVPAPPLTFAFAALWATFTRPMATIRTVVTALGQRKMGIGRRVRWLAYVAEAILLAFWLHRDRIDHVHAHFGNNGASTAMLAAQLAHIPFSFTCHGSELNDIRGHRLVDKVRRASFVACVSEYGRDRLASHCTPSEVGKLAVIRCGPPPLCFDPNRATHDGFTILCVARLSSEKAHRDLFEALAVLESDGLDFACRLVGDGPQRGELETLVDRMGLAHRVSMLGALRPDEVFGEYRAADVVVLASHSEGVPVVLMEAMAIGRPVVATNVGGVRELVIDGQTGLLVPPRDANRLARALRRIADDRDQTEKLVHSAHRFVHEKFSEAASADRLMDLFRQGKAVARCAPSPALACDIV